MLKNFLKFRNNLKDLLYYLVNLDYFKKNDYIIIKLYFLFYFINLFLSYKLKN